MPDVLIETKSYKKEATDYSSISQSIIPPANSSNNGQSVRYVNGQVKFNDSIAIVNFVQKDPEDDFMWVSDKSAIEVIEMMGRGPVIGAVHKQGYVWYLTIQTVTHDELFGDVVAFGTILASDGNLRAVNILLIGDLLDASMSDKILLPSATADDAGKILSIGLDGNAIWANPSTSQTSEELE